MSIQPTNPGPPDSDWESEARLLQGAAYDRLRQRVRRKLKRDIRPDVWGYLLRSGHVRDAWESGAGSVSMSETGESEESRALATLVAEYKLLRSLNTGLALEVPATDATYDNRRSALRRIAGVLAGRDEQVIAFRAEVLEGRLLSHQQAVAWLSRKAASPDDDLTRLSKLAAALADEWPWWHHPHHVEHSPVALFVLTGELPSLVAVRTTTEFHTVLGLSSITYQVLAYAVEPEEMEAHHRNARASVYGAQLDAEGRPRLKYVRPRSLDEKTAELAVFSVEHEGVKRARAYQTWEDHCARLGHNEWRFKNAQTYAQGAKLARRGVGLTARQ